MTLYAIEDARFRQGKPWIWSDSVKPFRGLAIDELLQFVRVFPEYAGRSRREQLRLARRRGLRVVKIRIEVVT